MHSFKYMKTSLFLERHLLCQLDGHYNCKQHLCKLGTDHHSHLQKNLLWFARPEKEKEKMIKSYPQLYKEQEEANKSSRASNVLTLK